jgi:hypothetical protein
MKLKLHKSNNGYGWNVTLYIRGRHRARWHSRKATTRMWPRVRYGGDENCNRATTLILWPLGHLDVWWEPNWREEGLGLCDTCLKEFGHGFTERADIFGGYLCICGASWTKSHETQVRGGSYSPFFDED